MAGPGPPIDPAIDPPNDDPPNDKLFIIVDCNVMVDDTVRLLSQSMPKSKVMTSPQTQRTRDVETSLLTFSRYRLNPINPCFNTNVLSHSSEREGGLLADFVGIKFRGTLSQD